MLNWLDHHAWAGLAVGGALLCTAITWPSIQSLLERIRRARDNNGFRQRLRCEGHGQPCYYCRLSIDGLAGDAGKWPLGLSHSDYPGVIRWHHMRCVVERLDKCEIRIQDTDTPPSV